MQHTQAQLQDRQQKWFNVNRSVSLGEIIVAIATILATTITAYFSIEKRVSILEKDQKFYYDMNKEFKDDMKKSIEELKGTTYEIKLMLILKLYIAILCHRSGLTIL